MPSDSQPSQHESYPSVPSHRSHRRLSVQICRDPLTTDVRLNVSPDRTSPHDTFVFTAASTTKRSSGLTRVLLRTGCGRARGGETGTQLDPCELKSVLAQPCVRVMTIGMSPSITTSCSNTNYYANQQTRTTSTY